MSEDAARAHATLEALRSATKLTGSLRRKIAESISTLTQIDEDLAAISATIQTERLKLVEVIGMYPNPFNAPRVTAEHPPSSFDVERKPVRGVSTPPSSFSTESKLARGISGPLSNQSTPRQDKGKRKNAVPKKPAAGAASLKQRFDLSEEESPKRPTETSPKRRLYTSDEDSPKRPSDESDRGPGPSKRAKPSTITSASAKTPSISEGMEV